MNLVEVYQRFPTQDDCFDYLETVRWKGTPTCPYCKSTNSTPAKKARRHHCNKCNTTYSVTVRTIFHRTHMPLQKWFLAITLVLNARKGISSRQLSRDLNVNKDTAWYLGMRIRKAMFDDRDLLTGIVEMDETFLGGKPRKGDPKGPGKRGRGTKRPSVFGMVERGGRVKAMHVKKPNIKAMHSLVRANIDCSNSTLMTDEFGGFRYVSKYIDHKTINHKVWYVDGDIHTNTIESFWAILKRGITGQFHKVSLRHLPRYIDEFCYRYNNRRNGCVFEQTIQRAVGGLQ